MWWLLATEQLERFRRADSERDACNTIPPPPPTPPPRPPPRTTGRPPSAWSRESTSFMIAVVIGQWTIG